MREEEVKRAREKENANKCEKGSGKVKAKVGAKVKAPAVLPQALL